MRQGFNVEVMTALGKIVNHKEVGLDIGDLFEVQNGAVIYKDADATGTMGIRRKVLIELLTPLAVAGGSWQKIEPIPVMTFTTPDDDKGLPEVIVLNNVKFHLPKSWSQNRVEGADDWVEVTFVVQGQVFYNLVPVFEHRDESGF